MNVIAKEKRVDIVIDGKTLHLCLGKTYDEWNSKYGGPDEDDMDSLWDFPIQELIDGSVEIDEKILYWYIDGRCYETTETVEKPYISRIKSCNSKLNAVIQEFHNALTEMVKAHGGFIELQDKKNDNIYGYALDGEFDELHEYNMLALSCDNPEGRLMCFLAPKFTGVQVSYTKEDMLNKENEDMWYCLDGTDGYLYSWATLVDMMELITEYDK